MNASDPQVLLAVLYVAAFAFLTVKCLRDGILPNRVVYGLALIALVARPQSLGVLPLDQFIAGVGVLAFGYALYSSGQINAGVAKVVAVVTMAARPEVALPAVAATFLVSAGVALAVARLRHERGSSSVRVGALFPLVGIHSVLWSYFPPAMVLTCDAALYLAVLFALVADAQRSPRGHIAGSTRAGTAPQSAVTTGLPLPSATAEHAPLRRVGDLIAVHQGDMLLIEPSSEAPIVGAADTGGSAVVLARRDAWIQVRDAAGAVGWLRDRDPA